MSPNPEQPIATLLDGYAKKSCEELDLLIGRGLTGLSAIANEDGSPAVMLFAGPEAGKVFLKLIEIMPELPEYREFLESIKPKEPAIQ